MGDARERLVQHQLYKLVDSAPRLRRFMESDVFAVWKFQSLLEALQQRLTCTSVPWLPTADPEARRLVNEIVLEEVSDEFPEGGYASHFEFYLDGMRDMCRRIVARLCGDDAATWAEGSHAARLALDPHITLWEALAADLDGVAT